MKLIKSFFSEIWSLFVDDPLFALVLAVWVVAVRMLLPVIPKFAAGPVLFAGFAVMLVAFAYRQAANKKNPSS